MTSSASAVVTVRLYAAAAHAAGRDEVSVTATDVASALAAVRALSADPTRFDSVVAQSSVLVDGLIQSRERTSALPAGATVEVLPPFAGG